MAPKQITDSRAEQFQNALFGWGWFFAFISGILFFNNKGGAGFLFAVLTIIFFWWANNVKTTYKHKASVQVDRYGKKEPPYGWFYGFAFVSGVISYSAFSNSSIGAGFLFLGATIVLCWIPTQLKPTIERKSSRTTHIYK